MPVLKEGQLLKVADVTKLSSTNRDALLVGFFFKMSDTILCFPFTAVIQVNDLIRATPYFAGNPNF